MRVSRSVVRVAGRHGFTAIREAIVAAPGQKETKQRLADLHAAFGNSNTAAFLSVKYGALAEMLNGGFIRPPMRRLIWLVWTLRFEPGRLRTWFDLISWGRFCAPHKPGREDSRVFGGKRRERVRVGA